MFAAAPLQTSRAISSAVRPGRLRYISISGGNRALDDDKILAFFLADNAIQSSLGSFAVAGHDGLVVLPGGVSSTMSSTEGGSIAASISLFGAILKLQPHQDGFSLLAERVGDDLGVTGRQGKRRGHCCTEFQKPASGDPSSQACSEYRLVRHVHIGQPNNLAGGFAPQDRWVFPTATASNSCCDS